MATYEERKASRAARLQKGADRARAEASQAFGVADSILDAIPMGQPILVGHHSEKRHRRDLARADANLHKGVESTRQAEHFEQLAAHSPVISSDCDDAVEQLLTNLSALEAAHERMKQANKLYPNDGWHEHLSDTEKAAALRNFQFWPGGASRPFPNLAGSTANIRNVRMRIAALEQRAAAPVLEPVSGPGWALYEDRADNRLAIVFDQKPDRDMLAALRSGGFKWSPTRGAHIRMTSNGAVAAARRILHIDQEEPQ